MVSLFGRKKKNSSKEEDNSPKDGSDSASGLLSPTEGGEEQMASIQQMEEGQIQSSSALDDLQLPISSMASGLPPTHTVSEDTNQRGPSILAAGERNHLGLTLYTPVRTEPLQQSSTAKSAFGDGTSSRRRVDRLLEDCVPEIHIIGQIRSGRNLIESSLDGAFCRWKLEVGKTWQHLGGDMLGQTQVAYPSGGDLNGSMIFSHPLDMHFALSGLQGWGAPRILLQSFRLDRFGRRILGGYGFVHIPMTPGRHVLDVGMWRPLGTADQELRCFILGETPSLVTQDPMYDSAWRDRCRLLTTSAGHITIELFIVTRYFGEQGVQQMTSQ